MLALARAITALTCSGQGELTVCSHASSPSPEKLICRMLLAALPVLQAEACLGCGA